LSRESIDQPRMDANKREWGEREDCRHWDETYFQFALIRGFSVSKVFVGAVAYCTPCRFSRALTACSSNADNAGFRTSSSELAATLLGNWVRILSAVTNAISYRHLRAAIFPWLQNLSRQAAFHHAAILEHQDFVAKRRQFAGVMRYVNEGDAKFVSDSQEKWDEPLF
jgi:hypothetical protein